jgi:hypothetical protein
LENARQPQRGNLIGAFAGNFFAVQEQLTACGFIKPGDDVEHGGFARTVGANETNNFALLNVQVKIINRDQTTKLHCQVINFQYVHGSLLHSAF